MREKDNGEKLLDMLANMSLSYDVADDAYQLAGEVMCELDDVKEENIALKEQIRKLECKLQQYAKLESMWDEQEVGGLCDVTIGDWIRPNIAPAIKKMKERIAELENLLDILGGDE